MMTWKSLALIFVALLPAACKARQDASNVKAGAGVFQGSSFVFAVTTPVGALDSQISVLLLKCESTVMLTTFDELSKDKGCKRSATKPFDEFWAELSKKFYELRFDGSHWTREKILNFGRRNSVRTPDELGDADDVTNARTFIHIAIGVLLKDDRWLEGEQASGRIQTYVTGGEGAVDLPMLDVFHYQFRVKNSALLKSIEQTADGVTRLKLEKTEMKIKVGPECAGALFSGMSERDWIRLGTPGGVADISIYGKVYPKCVTIAGNGVDDSDPQVIYDLVRLDPVGRAVFLAEFVEEEAVTCGIATPIRRVGKIVAHDGKEDTFLKLADGQEMRLFDCEATVGAVAALRKAKIGTEVCLLGDVVPLDPVEFKVIRETTCL